MTISRSGIMSSSLDLPKAICLEGINRVVQVETTEGSAFKGRLQSIDSFGNIELIDVRCTSKSSSISIEERVLIKGCSIRLIHLPPEVKLSPLANWRSENIQAELRKSLKPQRVVKKVSPSEQKPIRKGKNLGKKKYEDKKLRKLKR
eukprot:gene6222-4479_t